MHSHIHALGQCRKIIRKHRLEADGRRRHGGCGASWSPRWATATMAALAPRLAAELYGLDILEENVEDTDNNVTRFVVLSEETSTGRRARRPAAPA